MKQDHKTIDLTPSWCAAMQILIAALENGTNEGKQAAKQELMRLAEWADAQNEKPNTGV